MIRSSFVILERVGARLELNLWQQGCCTWQDFCSARALNGISPSRKNYYDRRLEEARRALNLGESEHFSSLLPKAEVWRLYEHFRSEAVFLDIETSGYYGDVTIVGLFDGNRTMTMVKGINLDAKQLRRHLKRYKLIVSYNGLSFDAAVLERFCPGIMPKVPHFDLRFACQRLGLVGGLKKVEKMLGIKRAAAVEDMRGDDAVCLWNSFRSTGQRKYLQKLIAYNEEDIVNLQPIAEHAYSELKARAMVFFKTP
jgi:uncharacterized protein